MQCCRASFADSIIFMLKKRIQKQQWQKTCIVMARTFKLFVMTFQQAILVPHKTSFTVTQVPMHQTRQRYMVTCAAASCFLILVACLAKSVTACWESAADADPSVSDGPHHLIYPYPWIYPQADQRIYLAKSCLALSSICHCVSLQSTGRRRPPNFCCRVC